MTNRMRVFTVGILIGCLIGCGSATTIEGGSPGFLWFGTERLNDICVVAHHSDGAAFKTVGFGTTDSAGHFRLLTPDGQSALHLEPGDYTFTLESVGPPVQFPEEYLQPETTPLKVTWTAEMSSLDLAAPEELIAAIAE